VVYPEYRFKQIPTDCWSTREKLALASSVMRSGDQNWWVQLQVLLNFKHIALTFWEMSFTLNVLCILRERNRLSCPPPSEGKLLRLNVSDIFGMPSSDFTYENSVLQADLSTHYPCVWLLYCIWLIPLLTQEQYATGASYRRKKVGWGAMIGTVFSFTRDLIWLQWTACHYWCWTM